MSIIAKRATIVKTYNFYAYNSMQYREINKVLRLNLKWVLTFKIYEDKIYMKMPVPYKVKELSQILDVSTPAVSQWLKNMTSFISIEREEGLRLIWF